MVVIYQNKRNYLFKEIDLDLVAFSKLIAFSNDTQNSKLGKINHNKIF